MSQPRPNDTVVTLRPHQAEQWHNQTRFECLVWHRRAGKSLFLCLRQLYRASEAKADFQSGYIAPTRLQAAQIIEPYLLQFAAPLGGKYNKSEQLMTLPEGQKLRLFSGENYERMRGLYLDDVVIDEAAQIPTAAWSQVISPAISDRGGKVTFCGTPAGHMNLLYQMLEYAQTSDDPDWSHSVLTWEDTGALSEYEVRRMQAQMSRAEFRQELECSFEGALRGAYYAEQMARVHGGGQVSSAVRFDESLPTFAALDLGHSNATVIVVAQRAVQELRILFAEAYVGTSFPEMVRQWRELPFPIDQIILPHDARVTELGTGKTRQESLEALGVPTVIAPKQSIDEGIDQVRRALPNCWFNTEGTQMLREALLSYRSEYDDTRQVHRLKPLHDWSSDWADAFRYLITGEHDIVGGWGERPAARLAI